MSGGSRRKQFRKDALVRWVEVLDDDKGQATILGYVFQKLLDCFQAAGRCADTHDRKRRGMGLLAL